MFYFVNRSVLAWLGRDEAAKALAEGGQSGGAFAEAMIPLMARFFVPARRSQRARRGRKSLKGGRRRGT